MVSMLSIVNRLSTVALCFAMAGCGSQQETPKISGPEFASDVVPIAPLKKVQQIDNPDAILLTVLGVGHSDYGDGGPLSISASAKGIDNCLKTGEEMTKLAVGSARTSKLKVSCVPQLGGHAFVRYDCAKNTGGQIACTLSPS